MGLVLSVTALLLCGCSQSERAGTTGPTHEPVLTWAVAPALNFSGNAAFDPVQVADLMASELTSVPGLGVIGPNRVLAILVEQGVMRIQSPEHALQVSERLGADAIVVFAITEYEPYTPVVAMAAQVYSRQDRPPVLDPVAASRMARPFPVPDRRDALRPVAQVQRVFNAEHNEIQRDVECYAESRDAIDSPYGWRKYLKSQQLYLRFCCYAVAGELMAQQGRVPAVAMAGFKECEP